MRGRWIFVIAFALVFYGNGAGFIESFVNYSSWHLIGEHEFVAYHQFISPRVLSFLVTPALLGTVFTILMLWARPATIPAWAVWAAIATKRSCGSLLRRYNYPSSFNWANTGDHSS